MDVPPSVSLSPSFWTDAAAERAERLWRAGLSARRIAALIGAASAAAVIGRARRQGWKRPARIAALNHLDAHRPYGRRHRFALPPDPPVSLARAPRFWLDRRTGECAFPVDAPGGAARSCCNPCAPATYCPAHAAIMRGPAAMDGEALAKWLEPFIR